MYAIPPIREQLRSKYKDKSKRIQYLVQFLEWFGKGMINHFYRCNHTPAMPAMNGWRLFVREPISSTRFILGGSSRRPLAQSPSRQLKCCATPAMLFINYPEINKTPEGPFKFLPKFWHGETTTKSCSQVFLPYRFHNPNFQRRIFKGNHAPVYVRGICRALLMRESYDLQG